MNQREKAVLIFFILAILISLVINFWQGWGSREEMKIMLIENKAGLSDTTKKEKSISKININECTAEDLMVLPGIGEVLARRIVEYRRERGGFQSKEEIMKVKGIGKKKYEEIRDKITVK